MTNISGRLMRISGGRSPLAPISHDLDLFALSMTWLLVTRYPSAEMKKPEPAPWRMRGRGRGRGSRGYLRGGERGISAVMLVPAASLTAGVRSVGLETSSCGGAIIRVWEAYGKQRHGIVPKTRPVGSCLTVRTWRREPARKTVSMWPTPSAVLHCTFGPKDRLTAVGTAAGPWPRAGLAGAHGRERELDLLIEGWQRHVVALRDDGGMAEPDHGRSNARPGDLRVSVELA